MRLVSALVLVVVFVAAAGFCRGWFHLSWGNSAVTATVDKDKVQQDKNEAQIKVADLKQK